MFGDVVTREELLPLKWYKILNVWEIDAPKPCILTYLLKFIFFNLFFGFPSMQHALNKYALNVSSDQLQM